VLRRSLLAALAGLALTGARCSLVASSGGGGGGVGLILVIGSPGTLRFVAPVCRGLRFRAGARAGFTTTGGAFTVIVGDRASFFIGDIDFGSTIADRHEISVLDLVAGGSLDDPAVINRARLLYSLDADPDDSQVTLPRRLDAEAKLSNPELGPLLAQLEFADDTAFDAVAPGVVALLTRDYPFTAVLIDRGPARSRLQAELARA
jgi:hypothetical protein